MTTSEFDVAIIGGGPAGLAAATTLARSRRKVALIDAGQLRNIDSPGAHNVLGHEGISPVELRAKGRAEVAAYGATLIDDTVTTITRTNGFTVVTASGETIHAGRIVLATGITDILPTIPGLAEGWGRYVLHCPYCHGWEARDSRIIVVGTSPMSAHQALLFSQLSDSVTLLVAELPDGEQLSALRGAGVTVAIGAAKEVDGFTLRLTDGKELGFDNLVIAPLFQVNGGLYESLGGELEQTPMGAIIPTGDRGRTPLDGVWSAGNNSNLASMIVGAMAEGVAAATDINTEMISLLPRA